MKSFFLPLLVTVAVLERTLFDLGPNIELVTLGLVLTSLYFGGRMSVLVTLSVLIISDILIGNTSIFLFTWSGFVIPALVAGFVLKEKTGLLRKIGWGTATGVGANLFFYAWTNFGVWLMEPTGMYTNDLSGLINSYINALPFLKLQLISTLSFVPMGIILTELAIKVARSSFPTLSPNFLQEK